MEDLLDSELEFDCPYCGEPNRLTVDLGGGPDQQFVSDCEVCCKPMHIHLRLQDMDTGDEEEAGTFEIIVRRDNEA